jgi:hypothetical protein
MIHALLPAFVVRALGSNSVSAPLSMLLPMTARSMLRA